MNNPNVLLSAPILESRNQYKCCHVLVPDLNERVAAIHTNGSYFSFFRVEPNKQRALEVAQRLGKRGDTSVITQTPRGFALWVKEPEARPHRSTPRSSGHQKDSTPTSFTVLTKEGEEYQHCFIRVPDLDKRLAAIRVENQYYSLFKTVEDQYAAVELLHRLSQRGDRMIVTQRSSSYDIWVLELDAQLADAA